ncbi:MAG: 5-dehydro-4-deoxy-D-glucuronate isomerase [Bacteroidia bacterium]
MIYEERYAPHPHDVRGYDTARIRGEFLMPRLFAPGEILLTYSLLDRFIAGGAMPVERPLALETIAPLRADYFLERRELGIVNVGGPARVQADGQLFALDYKDALYLGRGAQSVIFSSENPAHPARLYLNSAPAHRTCPHKLVPLAEAEVVTLGSLETANARTINKLIVASRVDTCQLQMGLTQLHSGSVWNTMPAHIHNRRMEVYFYFEVPHGQAVCHFMGQPDETRHIWMHNEQAVFSPSWSIHSGAGTSNYAFIWGMAGENLDYGDMDPAPIATLR